MNRRTALHVLHRFAAILLALVCVLGAAQRDFAGDASSADPTVRVLLQPAPSDCLPHPRGGRAAGEHGFGGGGHGEAGPVGACPDLKTYAPPPLSPALTPADTSYAYNYDEQLTSSQVPEAGGSQTLSLGYDSVGRLSTVADSLAGVTSTFKYAPGGLPESVASATTSGQTIEKLG